MIKLYDPNEKKETEFRIDTFQDDNTIHLWIVDLDGNYLETFAIISKQGIELLKIDPQYAPFKLTAKNYIASKYIY